MLKKIVLCTAGLTVLALLVGIGAYLWLVVYFPGEEILQGNIEKILAVESPVFYRDGHNKIGVVFEDAHRQLIPYEAIPKDFVNAIVAAEDHHFFSHCGVDFISLARAMFINVKAGRVVQGGSTITQQTAKNLFRRQDRTIKEKLKELLYALRLEHHYPKEKILEFYANQFYVSGNGHGLGVAANYYFDKPVAELSTLECAFIAGSVKRPNYYNPFIKMDEESANEAKERAKERAAYVLGQMHRLGSIDTAQYQDFIRQEINFQQGRMYYSLNTIMDQVKSALGEPEVEEAFDEHGIENVGTAGIRIYTTVEKDLQEEGLYALRKELSQLDVRLKGYDHLKMQEQYRQATADDSWPQPKAFLYGRIVGITKTADPRLDISFGIGKGGPAKGTVDRKGLMNLVDPLVKFNKQRWSEVREGDLMEFLEQFREGDLVYVSVRQEDGLTGEYLLDLEKYPELQGGLIVMKDGEIRAMAGGMENKFFNRAVNAKRPMGSVVKPLVYSAAMQLGWNNLDGLLNTRNMFVYQNRLYFPRPDHTSFHRQVSMSWAGVYSENVASVWLVYHLCDQLSPAQFKELLVYLGLDRAPTESYGHYMQRIRDQYGVVVDRSSIENAAFEKALSRVGPDLLFDGRQEENNTLLDFHYRTDMDVVEEEVQASEAALRSVILQKSFVRFQQLVVENIPPVAANTDSEALLNTLVGKVYRHPISGALIYAEENIDPGWRILGRPELEGVLSVLDHSGLERFRAELMIEGLLQIRTVELLQEEMAHEYRNLAMKQPYDPEVLHNIREFRVMAGLQYLVGLGRALGVESKLEPVLSFPLGSNVMSLFEVARIYEGLTTGSVSFVGGEKGGARLSIIDRIESREGEIIYQPQRLSRKVVAPEISLMVNDILRNVVRYGTGRWADLQVRLHSHDQEKEERLTAFDWRFPVFGKTGTANNFTTSSFAGFVPGLSEDGSVAIGNDGYVMAAYVGFDDNQPMVWKSTHITGAAGALLAWTRMANAIILERDYAGKVDLVDLSFGGFSEFPLLYPDRGQVRVAVDTQGNGMMSGDLSAITVSPAGQKNSLASNDFAVYEGKVNTFVENAGAGQILPARFFRPYWREQ